MGPTASGKTDLALALAEHLPCDIISVDSAMVYRGMDIQWWMDAAGVLDEGYDEVDDIVRARRVPYSGSGRYVPQNSRKLICTKRVLSASCSGLTIKSLCTGNFSWL